MRRSPQRVKTTKENIMLRQKTQHFAFLVLATFFCICLTSDTFAFSDAEHREYLNESSRYAKADKRLNEIWQQIKEKLPKNQYAAVLEEQKRWNKGSNRDVAAMITRETRGLSMADRHALVIENRIKELEAILSASASNVPPPRASSSTAPPPSGAPIHIPSGMKWDAELPKGSPGKPEAGKPFTFVGRGTSLRANLSFEEIPERSDRGLDYFDESKASKAFLDCIMSSVGSDELLAEITINIQSVRHDSKYKHDSISMELDKSATCRLFNLHHKKYAALPDGATLNTYKHKNGITTVVKSGNGYKVFGMEHIAGDYTSKSGTISIRQESNDAFLVTFKSADKKCAYQKEMRARPQMYELTSVPRIFLALEGDSTTLSLNDNYFWVSVSTGARNQCIKSGDYKK